MSRPCGGRSSARAPRTMCGVATRTRRTSSSPHGRSIAPSRWRGRSRAISTSSTWRKSGIALGTLREADYDATGTPEGLTAALGAVRTELGDEGLDGLLATLRVHPVFTAHPTEARRRAVTSVLRRVGEQLDRLADPRVSEAPQVETRRRLLEEVDGLWRTAQLRSQELQPLDEVRDPHGRLRRDSLPPGPGGLSGAQRRARRRPTRACSSPPRPRFCDLEAG